MASTLTPVTELKAGDVLDFGDPVTSKILEVTNVDGTSTTIVHQPVNHDLMTHQFYNDQSLLRVDP
ncbi:MAG: hypothetical protein AAGF92_14645 [Myxococcota bacterium]